MALDSLLKPVKFVDEQILRQYTKITKKWEDKGHSRYTLSNMINIPSLILTGGLGDPYNMGFFHGWNLVSDNITKPYGRDFNVQESSSRVEDGDPIIKMTDRVTRLPLMIAGVGFTGLGLYEIVSGFWNRDNQNLSEGLVHLSHGLPFIGIASSQYVKDANPKLLDKKPFWKKAYDWAKEKVGSLAPQPSPQPVPVQAYSTLDSYIQAQPLK